MENLLGGNLNYTRMGVRAGSSSDRLRTVWTPEMDRYFIDLMLEQVRKGNRIDSHLFSKRAWKHMTSLFSAKFNYEYEKDVLKNRHKTLRNLYKGVKNLLDQKGFSWDETRQMVTASNKIWDDHIKVHPDARSYRIKTIAYYSDLCEIYRSANMEGKGDHCIHANNNVPGSDAGSLMEGFGSPATTFDDMELGNGLVGSSSHSGGDAMVVAYQPSCIDEAAVETLHEIIIDEDFAVSETKGNVDDTLQPASDLGSMMCTRSRTYWQPPMDRYFIDLMLGHVQKGDQMDGLFHKQAWMEMIASFNAKFGFRYDVDILKNRYKTLRRQYTVIKNLLELEGFEWDDARQMVTADDCVWQDYIKAHTDARQYMTRPVPYFNDLRVICRVSNIDERNGLLDQYLDQQDEFPAASVFSEDLLGNEQESSHLSVSDQKNKRHLENPTSSANSKKQRSQDKGMSSALREMATAVSSLADKRNDNDNSSCISIETVIKAIQSLPDMDEDLILDACDLLEDEKKAKTFLALDVKLRKKWLIRKLRPHQQ